MCARVCLPSLTCNHSKQRAELRQGDAPAMLPNQRQHQLANLRRNLKAQRVGGQGMSRAQQTSRAAACVPGPWTCTGLPLHDDATVSQPSDFSSAMHARVNPPVCTSQVHSPRSSSSRTAGGVSAALSAPSSPVASSTIPPPGVGVNFTQGKRRINPVAVHEVSVTVCEETTARRSRHAT